MYMSLHLCIFHYVMYSMHVYMCVYVCMYVCVYMYVFNVYVYLVILTDLCSMYSSVSQDVL